MSKAIYQLFIIKNSVAASMAAKALSEAERKALMEKEQASREAVGAKPVVFCNSAWADEEHPMWGVIRFPSIEARIEHTNTLQKIGWLDMGEVFTLLGTSESEPDEVTFPNPIYKLWIIKSNPAAMALQGPMPKGLEAALWEKHNAIYHETGSIGVLMCDSYWCNEGYLWFGVSAYPSIEANMKVMQTLADLGWQRNFDTFTLLGIPMK
jgi:hypothetical protein